MKFAELGLSDKILEALGYMGFEEATPIQSQAIPVILEGRDIIGCAQTGTGKTAAFILPMLQIIAQDKGSHIKTIIVAPTRELAIQIERQIQGFAYFMGIESIAIYGGGDGAEYEEQKKALKRGTDIIVATPGKFISHLNMGYMDLTKVKFVILDEADRMLDIGFHDDIIKIIKALPKTRQSLMFSATMPSKIRQLTKEILTNPHEITLALSKPAAGVLQAVYLAHETQKKELLIKLIQDKPKYTSIIVFSSTKKKISEIVRALKRKGMNAEGISSDLMQKEREAVMRQFRAKNTRILVATDVISRGIDVKEINLVINFDVPGDAEDYVHRVGRTARADTTGVAITFVHEDDMYKMAKIEKLIEREIPKIPLPPELGPGPIWSDKRPSGRGYKSNRGGGRSNRNSGRGGRSGGGRSGNRSNRR